MKVINSVQLGMQEKTSLDNRKMPKVEGIPNTPYENKLADTSDKKSMSPDYMGDMYKIRGAFVDKLS
ncbi:hypothetical protein CH373_00350 [Leptospira perolatii]|uniref:Uncharacterized protein n=1 Tax=Leptospira perolatii TaxID=2023191 RepID=A0A2M9ZRF4_9LEPT|nr:hypothetical protein [Leptospira perolatii]PJZ71019.1 hypothetical protein CH360_00350 [Leptospira perolatii]PJZ74551.1 hypothetical protein CH373_00350 [Leptospira perolatii]